MMDLVERLRDCRDEMALRTGLLESLGCLGARDFIHFTLVEEADALHGEACVFIWSGQLERLCREYMVREHWLRDPVLVHASLSVEPYRLSRIATLPTTGARLFYAFLHRHGASNGIAIPVHGSSRDPTDVLVALPQDDTADGEAHLLDSEPMLRALAYAVRAWRTSRLRAEVLARGDLDDIDQMLLQLTFRGFTRNDIAHATGLSVGKVKGRSARVSNIFRQRSIEQAARLAVRVGIVRLV
jgi:hypothetical protein